MAGDDLVRRLCTQAHDMMFNDCLEAETMREAAARIETLEAQLAARDAEIVAWLRKGALKCRRSALVPASYANAEAHALEVAATAIASGDYAKGQTDAQQGD